MLDFPDAPGAGWFHAGRLFDGAKWTDEENHWVVSGYPIGAMINWSRPWEPRYWLPCDHREVSRAQYAALYAKIGDRYGAGNGSTTFNLPDTRARITIGANAPNQIGWAGGDERTQWHTHPISDYGHGHGIEDPSHQHGMWSNGHSHGVPGGWHGHGLGQSPHDHGVGDPGHNHGIHDWGHSHNQDHSWGPMHLSLEGGEFDSASVIDGWNFAVHENWAGVWNDANWTGCWWYGEYAWIGCDGNGTGCWMDASLANISEYYGAGTGHWVHGSGAGTIWCSWTGDGGAGNVQPSIVVGKIIYAGA